MPDARVQAAIDNWAPRMVTQGVDYNDFVRTTARIEAWDEWLVEWTRTADLHLELRRDLLGKDLRRVRYLERHVLDVDFFDQEGRLLRAAPRVCLRFAHGVAFSSESSSPSRSRA